MTEDSITEYVNNYVPRGYEMTSGVQLTSGVAVTSGSEIHIVPSGAGVINVIHSVEWIIEESAAELGLDSFTLTTSGLISSPVDLNWYFTSDCWRCFIQLADKSTVGYLDGTAPQFADFIYGTIFFNPPLVLSAGSSQSFHFLPVGTPTKDIKVMVKYEHRVE